MTWRLLALIAGAMGILAGAILVAGAEPWQALLTLYRGSLGSTSAQLGTLREATPLIICGAAVFVALRAGLFNIGVEGQLLVGAAGAAGVALHVSGIPGILGAILIGSLGGALWAFPAAWIRAYRGGHEVITTIMLNSVAVYFTGWLLAGPLKDRLQESPTTATIDAATRLPNWAGINVASILGVALTLALGWWLARTVGGYALRAVGANARAAEFAGIRPSREIMRAMLLSGAIAGFAGALQVLAYEGRFYAGFSPGYGFDALGVALLAGNSALAVLPAGVLFGILAKGGTALQLEGIPKGVTTIVLGLLIVIAAAVRYRQGTADA